MKDGTRPCYAFIECSLNLSRPSSSLGTRTTRKSSTTYEAYIQEGRAFPVEVFLRPMRRILWHGREVRQLTTAAQKGSKIRLLTPRAIKLTSTSSRRTTRPRWLDSRPSPRTRAKASNKQKIYGDRDWLPARRLDSGGSKRSDTPDAHFAAAKSAAGDDFKNLLNFQCYGPGQEANAEAAPGAQGKQGGGGIGARGGRGQGPPDRSTWYAEPVKVFDNLYFFGQSEYAVWAITTSQGIIVLDTIFDYSVEEEVAGGMKKLGLDPANIKYAVVSRATPITTVARASCRIITARGHHVAGGLGCARQEDQRRQEAEAGSPRPPTTETHARRYHADAVYHAGPHTGHHLYRLSGQGQRDATPGGSVGRGRSQCRPGIHSDLHPVGATI